MGHKTESWHVLSREQYCWKHNFLDVSHFAFTYIDQSEKYEKYERFSALCEDYCMVIFW